MRFSFFVVSSAVTYAQHHTLSVRAAKADSKHSVDGSLCDKSQALDGPLKRIAMRFSFFLFAGLSLAVISLVLLFAPASLSCYFFTCFCYIVDCYIYKALREQEED